MEEIKSKNKIRILETMHVELTFEPKNLILYKQLMEKNIIYNQDYLADSNIIKNECVDLIIADPPYFKVINESWDYKWRVEEEYLDWTKQWLQKAYYQLKKGGSIYIFGYFRMLSKIVPILEELGFELRQQIIINKGMQAVSGRATKNYRMFPNATESILFAVKDSKPFVKRLLKEKQKELKLKSKEINDFLEVKSNGGGMWSIYTGDNICKQLPTREYWEKLQKLLKIDIDYDSIKMTFNPQMGVTDVWDDISFYSESRIHPTQKPLKLIERLVLTSSNENDIVLDPFMGSGTTAIACQKNNRFYVGFEIDENYYLKALERLSKS